MLRTAAAGVDPPSPSLNNPTTQRLPVPAEAERMSTQIPSRQRPLSVDDLQEGGATTQAKHAFSGAPSAFPPPIQEYHSGYSDADSDSLHSTHRRQQSFPNFLAQSLRNRTPSPVRRSPRPASEMPFTGDARRESSASSTRAGIGGWFSGMSQSGSAATSPGIDDRTPNGFFVKTSRDATPDATPTRARKSFASVNDASYAKNAVANTASKWMSAISSTFGPSPTSPVSDEKMLNMDIEAALFPGGAPSERDAFSPSAFKNLQANALGLLRQMQEGYRQKSIALRDLQTEKGAQQDEFEEAETRAQHLKMQLEEMAKISAEQEKEMNKLKEELAAERKGRTLRDKNFSAAPEGSTVSEDLGVDDDLRKRNWRKSGGTVKSEMSFDTDEESMENESVFSRSRSPTVPPIGFEAANVDGSASHLKAPGSSRHRPPQQLNALQKIIKGISGEPEDGGVNGCRNCKGQNASVAWDTVSLLRDENKHLKVRVGELESHVEVCLDLVNGVGL